MEGKGVTSSRTCFNLLNTLAGLGILSVSHGLASGGWSMLALFLLVAIVCCYTSVLLQRCMDANSFVNSYPDIGELAFGRKGRITVATFMYVELYVVAVEFLVLVGDHMIKLFPFDGLKLLGLSIGGKYVFVVLATLIVLPTTWLRNLGVLAYVSLGGVLASSILVGCIAWSGAVDGVGFHEKGRVVHWAGIPTAVSLFLFCFSGHAVFPTIYASMRNKTQFYPVLVICFSLSTLYFVSAAVMGYLMFGDEVKAEVTLNLPTEKFNSKLAVYTMVLSPLTKYALLILPMVEGLEDAFQVSKSRLISLLLSTLVVGSTMVVALAVPFFGHLVALTGSLLSTTTSVLLPCVCYLKIFKSSAKPGLEKLVVISIIIAGACIVPVGTYISFKKIITSF